MKLREFYQRYKREKKANDFLSVFYTDERGQYPRRHIDNSLLDEDSTNERRAERAALLLEADIMQCHVYETEGTHYGGGGFKCREYSAEINADQAMIALKIHPAIKKETQPAVKKPKPKPKAKRRGRFTL